LRYKAFKAVKHVTILALTVVFFGVFFVTACVRAEKRTPPEEAFLKLTEAELAGYTLAEVDEIRQNPIHGMHFSKGVTTCNTCHAQRKDLVAQDVELCKKCHADVRFNASVVQRHCINCHNFKRTNPEESDLPIRGDCAKCHTAKEQEEKYRVVFSFFDENSAMKIDCRYCHRPHEVGEFTPLSWCQNCHGNYANKEILIEGHQVCTTCHQPHTWKFAFTKENCTKCHTQSPQVVEHILPFHPKDCNACHNPHFKGAVPKTGDCQSCHKEKTVIQGKLIIPHKNCLSCHSARNFAFLGGKACLSCHKKDERFSLLASGNAPKAHIACNSCHKPHNFVIGKSKMTGSALCVSCHTPPPRNIAHNLPSHKGVDCLNCHKPHLFPKPPSASSCSSCHPGRADVEFAKNAPHIDIDCSSCHQMKPFKFVGIDSSCKVCHSSPPDRQESSWDKAPGLHYACLYCHKPHNFKIEDADSSCASCHQRVSKLAQDAGMPFCVTCHESPHIPNSSPSLEICSTCHSDISERVSGTAKTNCFLCHKPHQFRAQEGNCASCHSEIQKAIAQSPMNDCSICHSGHSFTAELSVQNCTVCHAERQGLHNQEFHLRQSCNTCHRAHTFKPTRAICETCHADKKDHYPQEACAKCHLFISGQAFKERE